MYCNNCGKSNPKGSKFCQKCGIKLRQKLQIEGRETESTGEMINQHVPPYPYVISVSKLAILSITTFGFYNLYWMYRQFNSLKYDRNWQISPGVRAFFGGIMAYSLFRKVSEIVNEIDRKKHLEAGALAIAYFLLLAAGRAEDWLWTIGLFAFLPLIPVQNALNFYWENKYNNNLEKSEFGDWNYLWAIVGGIILSAALYGTFSNNTY